MTTTPRLRVPAFVSVAVLAFIAISADGYDLAIFGAAIPDLLADPDWGLTPARIGVIAGTAIAGMCLGSIAAGVLADRFGARRLFLVCVTWFSGGMILCAAAPTAELLGIARFVAGLGLGGLGPAAIALTMSVAPHDRRNFLNGVMLTVVPIGAAKLRTWAPDIAVTTTAPRQNGGVSLRALLGDGGARALAGFVVVTGCCQILSYGLLTWLPQIMKSSGYSLGSSLVFLIVFSIGAMAGSATGSWAADHVGGRRITIAGFAIGAVAIFGLAMPLSQPILYLSLLLAGAGTVGIQPVVYGFAALHFPAHVRGSALGFIGGIGRIGGVFGPMLGGVLAGLPALANFSVFAGIAVFASLLSLAVLTNRHPEPAPTNTTVPADA
ncbi:MFS transporter [Rhodococcus sp. NPDC057529]|uniref:MFS transporter n=1 Tax=Rhodococcus sp. NPDC057529 TaxID=3346158 RepID=UPI00366C4082